MKSVRCVLLPLVLTVLSGCNQPRTISGQVFIVTESTENKKLGLVLVSAIPAEEMRNHLERKKRELFPPREERIRAAQTSLHEAELQYQAEYDKLSPSADAVNPALIKARDARDAARKRAEQASLETSKPLAETLEYCFSGYPSPIAQSTTDADGRFQLRLPGSKPVAVIASTSRKVGASEERYFWLIWPSLQDSEILLSNNNLLSDVP